MTLPQPSGDDGCGCESETLQLLIGSGHPAACRRICRRLELSRAFVPRWDARAYDAHGERGIVLSLSGPSSNSRSTEEERSI